MNKETFINAWGVPEEVQPNFTQRIRMQLRESHPDLPPMCELEKYTLDIEIPISKYAEAECVQIVKEAAMRK